MNIPQILLNKPAPGAKLNFSHPLSKGLVGCWLFNEQTGLCAFDSSPYKNHGKLVNFNDPTSKDRSSLGLKFDGADDYINCGNDPSLNITDAITIEAWVKDNGSSSGGIVGKAKTDSERWHIYLVTDSAMYFSIGTNYGKFDPTTIIGTTNWKHLVMVFDGSLSGNANRLKAFVDSVQQTLSFIGTISATLPIVDESVMIGKSVSTYFKGSIDGVKIYNRALVKDEIILAYQHPYAMFNKR